MFPTLQFGSFHIATYNVIIVLAVVLGGWLGARQAMRAGVDWSVALNIATWGGVGGFIGARLYSVITGGLGHAPLAAALTSGGLVWYGGAIGGILTGMYVARRSGLPLVTVFDQAAPAIIGGHALGRMACLAGGDDYGWSSNLPWAIAFPHGHPPSTAGYLRQMGDHIAASISDATVMRVQPTMVYEAIGNALIAMWLWRRSHGRYRPWSNISLYFLSYGILRFTLEFLRPKDDRFSFGLTGAQLVSIAFVIIGAIGLQAAKRRPPASVQEQLEEAGGVPAAVRITG